MRYFMPVFALTLTACSSSEQSKSSSFEGTVGATSGGKPSAIRATDEAGTLTRAQLGANGSFKLTLDKGHSYRLEVIGTSVEPVVFPRASGSLDTVFHVSGGGARVTLGQLHHYDAAPTGGFAVIAQTRAALSTGAPVTNQCVDGSVPGTGAACADDDGSEMTCEAADDGAEAEDGEAADGKCVNGKDSVSGLPCTDAPGGGAADPASPMTVPDHNVPGDVGGCDEEEDDD